MRIAHELEVLVTADDVGHLASQCQRRLDRVAVGADTVDTEREPQWKPASATSELVCVVAGIPLVLGMDDIEVRRILRVHPPRCLRVAIEKRTGVKGRKQPLVRVYEE